MSIIDNISNLESERVKEAFIELIADYLTPAYGSISKRDFEILLFMKLQELGVVDANPEIYDMVSSFRISRTKARNLLYDAKMRSSSKEDLDRELVELIKTPKFYSDNDKISLEVGNPFLIDHLKAKLKNLGYITDASFSPELVRMTEQSFIALFDSMMTEKSKKEVKKALIQCGAKEDDSFQAILTSAVRSVTTKFMGEAGGRSIGYLISDYLAPILEGNIDKIKERFKGIFD